MPIECEQLRHAPYAKETCKHCDECANHRAVIGNELACVLDHKPRWFSPKNDNPHDQNYGWKRRCEDFRELRHNAGAEPREASASGNLLNGKTRDI